MELLYTYKYTELPCRLISAGVVNLYLLWFLVTSGVAEISGVDRPWRASIPMRNACTED